MFPVIITRKLIHPVRQRLIPWHREVQRLTCQLMQSQWETEEHLREIQQQKLRQLLLQAKNTDFYNTVLSDTGLEPQKATLADLKLLPVMTKTGIRKEFGNLVNRSIPSEQLRPVATGGSTGEPLKILRTRDDAIFATAIKARNMNWTGWRPGDSCVKLWGAPTDVMSAMANRKERVQNYIYNRQFVDAFDVTEELLEKTYQNFSSNMPALIESYVNILYEFARYIEKTGKAPLQAKSVVSSAGTLEPFRRELIEQYFGTRIFNRYGCREVGDIAHECEQHRGMHINMERFIVEIDNPDERGVGEILVTDLENLGFPIIRYKIGDRGKLATTACTCGRGLSMLATVDGRSLDLIITPDGKKVSGELFPHLFKDYPNIITGQVIQEDLQHLNVLIQLANPADRDCIDQLSEKIGQVVGPAITLDIKVVDRIAVTRTGKYRPVISKVAEQLEQEG